MKPGLIHAIKKKLAATLAAAMLVTGLLPAAAGASDATGAGSAAGSVGEAVYSPGDPVQTGLPAPLTGTPLTWNLLMKPSRDFMASIISMGFDDPVTELSSDEKYLAFLSYDHDYDTGLGRRILQVADRSTGLYSTVKTPDETGTVVKFDLSPDARYIAYSYATNYISADVRVYLYDRTADTLETVNATAAASGYALVDNGVSVSADGRYVVFDTMAEGLVEGDANAKRDVYLYDRLAEGSKLSRLSTPILDGSEGDSRDPAISADGSKIAFVSEAELVTESGYVGTDSVFLYSRTASGWEPVKRIHYAEDPSLSGDGRYLAMTSSRDDLGVADTNERDDIYVYDHTGDVYRKVSRAADGTEFPFDSSHPFISTNGAYVAYETAIGDDEDLTEIYVSDREGLMSSKVTVPGAGVPLLAPARRPAVGDTGGTVTFFSKYQFLIGGFPVETYDYFIAANGDAPVWPAGSVLTASGEGPDRITLSWPEATDPDRVTGYVLYKNGLPVAHVPAGQSTSITLANQVRDPDMDITFHVEAIDSRYHTSMNGPSYIWESTGGENPPPEEIPAFIAYRGEYGQPDGPLKPGSKITLYARGAASQTATAVYEYKEYEAPGSDVTVSRTGSVPLTESSEAPGFYTGFFNLTAGATELTSMKLVLTGGTGAPQEEEAEDLPIAVGGGLQIEFGGATAAELKGAYLSYWSVESGSNDTVNLGDKPLAPFVGLWPGEDYEIVLHTAGHEYELGRLEGVRVAPGRTNTVTLPVELPSSVRVKVVDAENRPVDGIPVKLWSETGDLLQDTYTHADGMTTEQDRLLRNQTVRAELDLSDAYYELASGAELSKRLDAGDNVITVPLRSPDRGRLELKVMSPADKPVFNAYVTVTQTYKGKPIVTTARTSLDGIARFEVFAGEVVIEAQEFSYHYSSGPVKATVLAEVTTPMEIPVRQPEKGIVNLRIFKKALDTEWQGPLNMENERFHSYVTTNYGWVSTYFSNAVSIGGSPGTPVQVCVSGSIYAYVSECSSEPLDENSNATVEVRLEETGARVQGTVEMASNIYYSAEVYELKPNGSKEWVTTVYDNSFETVPFNVNVPKGGNFRMQLNRTIVGSDYKRKYEYASVDFNVEENQIKNIDPITFSGTSHFVRKSGNSFSAQPARAVPGGLITLRAAYRNNNDAAAEGTKLLLDIPEGMSLVSDDAGRLAVTGAVGTPVVNGRTLEVPVGSLAKDDAGTVTYRLKVAPDFNKSAVSAAARIQTVLNGTQVEETIGTVHLDTPKVTLEAPARVADPGRAVTLSGYAPAGSTVAIYDSKVRIGGAVANASGLWKTTLPLADLGNPSVHALWAETAAGAITLQSPRMYTEFNTEGPQLLKMAFAQAPAGRWVTVEIGKPAPDFAYTVVPGYPFLFDFEFTNPDMVENVRVYIDGQEGDPIPAVREGDLFRATVPTTANALGGIYVDYDVLPTLRNYDGTLPDLSAVRESLPPGMRDFEVVSVEPLTLKDGKYEGSAVLRFPQLDGLKLIFTMSVNPDSGYRPPAEDIAALELTGVPAISKTTEFVDEENYFSVKMGGYIPTSLLEEEEAGAGLRSMLGIKLPRLPDLSAWEHTAEYAMEIKSDVDAVKGQIDDVKGQYEGYMGYAKKINKIMYNMETSGMDCLDEMPTTAKQFGKALAVTILGEIGKTAMGAAVGAMSLSGPGAIVAGKVSGMIGDKIDSYVDQQIDAVGSGYNECNDPDKKKKKGRKVADPKWIYDPSGYVYEAVPGNRLEGVTATVLYLETNTGLWKVWKAEEYDQVNPQQTDELGKYGWDVPPGKWKVVWTKDGYQTAASGELDVPPPQTEVNAGLISYAAPVMNTVTGVTYEGGSYVDITFSKYLKVTGLPEGAVTVTDGSHAVLEGTAVFMGSETDPANSQVKLSRTVRFTPKTKLAAGGAYQVQLNRIYFTSYAGVMMLEQDSGPAPAAMKVLDTTAPAAESVQVESGGRTIRVTYNEAVQGEADAAKYQVNGAVGSVASAAVLPKRSEAEVTRVVLLTLTDPVVGAANLKLLPGGVKDLEGNGSAEGDMALQADLNPSLSALALGQGQLSPAFSASVTQYTVELPVGTKELGITATAADPSAKLAIGDEPAVSGMLKKAAIPEDGVIRVTVELAGVAVRTYTITVRYVTVQNPPPGDPGGNPVPLPATKNPSDLGEKAVVERTTAANGGSAMVMTVRKEDVAEALKDGQKSKELYVDVKEALEEFRLQVPAEAVRMLQDSQALLTLRTQLVQLQLAMDALGDTAPKEQAALKVTLARLEEAAAAAADLAAKKQSAALRKVMDAVRIHADVGTGGSDPLAHVNAAKGMIPVVSGDSLEIYRFDEATGKWSYVNSGKTADGKGLEFDLQGSGTYSAMRFESTFGDTIGHWAEQDIDWMARRLHVNGVASGEFRPDASVTRAEFVTMLVRILRLQAPAANGTGNAPSFGDVRAEDWYYDEIRAAASSGLVNGLEAGRFGPEEEITREQMAVLIGRAFRALGMAQPAQVTVELEDFADGGLVKDWAQEDVTLVLNAGLMQGKGGNSFAPEGPATRAEAAVVMERMLKKRE